MRLRLLLALFMLGACARVRPTHVPTMADAALSPDDDCAAFDSTQLNQRLDRRTHSVRRESNAAELLVNGVESWAKRVENARDADLILVKTFIYSDDEAGQAVSSLLRARARAGATVIVQYDIKGSLRGVGEMVSSYDASASDRFFRDKPILADMVDDGVIVVPTNVPKRGREARRFERARTRLDPDASRVGLLTRVTGARDFGNFDHEKYWITGHREEGGGVRLAAIMGGMNIASEYAYGGTTNVDAKTERYGWRDTDIELRGPVTLDILAPEVGQLGERSVGGRHGARPFRLESARAARGAPHRAPVPRAHRRRARWRDGAARNGLLHAWAAHPPSDRGPPARPGQGRCVDQLV
jgi:phosphatidylserine/phosphatidylglycerophosphate/cardiolipin synthase-like enzyme